MSNSTEKWLCLFYATLVLGLGSCAAWQVLHCGGWCMLAASCVCDFLFVGWIYILLDIDNSLEIAE